MITHLILLDNRYWYNQTTNDRLGEEQWQWFNESLKTQADLTLILAGVEMLRDNSFVEETFRWENKQKLYQAIVDNQKSNAFLLSGDVHSATVFQTPCASLTGYNLLEFTSSGLTHTVHTFFAPVADLFEGFHEPLYTVERIFGEFNYG